MTTPSEQTTVAGFSYWELFWGGLFDARDHDGLMHLVRAERRLRDGRPVGFGTPGPTLCGIDRFAKDGPGGGWRRDPGDKPLCDNCVKAADDLGLERIGDV